VEAEMNDADLAMHYVCTHAEARALIAAHDRFWISNCGCRESRRECARSRMDLCLMFSGDQSASGSGMREATRAEAEANLREAETQRLVTRPFYNERDRAITDGICFCCDDCCGYFLHPEENRCDNGAFIEETDLDACTGCGDCVEACYFGARNMEDGALLILTENCYGCGLCADVCPAECVRMVKRT